MTGGGKAAVAVGAFSGGLFGYYLTRTLPWASIKKVAAIVALAVGGGGLGYGISKLSDERRGYRTAGLRGYPSYESSSSVIQESAVAFESSQKKLRAGHCGKNTCLRPEDSLRGDMLQWVELVKTPKAVATGHVKFQSSQDIYHYLKDAAMSPQENMYVLLLNNQNNAIGHVLVARGSKSEAAISPDDIFRPALLAGASRVIVAHNHPSGEVSPSPQDVALTRRLSEAGKVINVQLLDHLIVSERGYTSMRDVGLVN